MIINEMKYNISKITVQNVHGLFSVVYLTILNYMQD